MTEHIQQDELDLGLGDETEDVEVLTVNQLVAYNLMRLRRTKGWTQQETAEKVAARSKRKWTAATLSAAERSWQTGRSRQFDANELVTFAAVFECPIAYLFMPIQTSPRREIFYALSKVDIAMPFPIVLSKELLDLAVPLRYPSSMVDQVNALRRPTGITWSPFARVERWDEAEEAYYEHMASTAEEHEGNAEENVPPSARDERDEKIALAVGRALLKSLQEQGIELMPPEVAPGGASTGRDNDGLREYPDDPPF